MKGIVFTGFLELVESKFGLELVNQIIDECDLESQGVFTSVGTYNHKDMHIMVAKLSELKNVPVADLLQLYGEHFFSVLHQSYPQFMNQPNLFNFLKSIDNYVHPEVLKLYPEAELPTFSAEMNNENEMNLTYNSSRKMSDFAIGLIKGAGLFFKENIIVEKSKEENEGEKVVIKIKKVE